MMSRTLSAPNKALSFQPPLTLAVDRHQSTQHSGSLLSVVRLSTPCSLAWQAMTRGPSSMEPPLRGIHICPASERAGVHCAYPPHTACHVYQRGRGTHAMQCPKGHDVHFSKRSHACQRVVRQTTESCPAGLRQSSHLCMPYGSSC